MTALGTLTGASPLNADDASRLLFTTNTTETLSRALDDMPAGFGNMNTLSWQVDYRQSGRSDDTLSLGIRIVNGATILAAADSGGTFATVSSNVTSTTDVLSSVTAFAYVNTSANKATWDGATIELQQTYSQTMGPDGARIEVDYVAITGDYSGAATFINDAFRIYDDDVAGGITSQTALAAVDTNWTQDVETVFHVAMLVTETGSVSGSFTPKLQYRLNGGTWTDVADDTPIQLVAPDNCTTTNGSSYGTTALTTGATIQVTEYSTDGTAGAQSLNNSSYEVTFPLKIVKIQVIDNESIELRLTNNGTAITDTTIPTITTNDLETSGYSVSIDPADYTTLVEDTTYTALLNIDGTGSDTLYRNCTFHNHAGNGVDLRDVTDITFYNCRFYNLGGRGARGRGTGDTSRIAFVGCVFIDIDTSGLLTAQLSSSVSPPTDQDNWTVDSCYFENVGTSSSSEHMLYLQGTEFTVRDSEFRGDFGGNVISVRSSGVITGNTIHKLTSTLDSTPAAIKYYSDHKTGASKTLEITNNTVDGGNIVDWCLQVRRAETGTEWDAYTGAEEDWHINTLNWWDNTLSNAAVALTVIDEAAAETPYTSETWFTENTSAGGAIAAAAGLTLTAAASVTGKGDLAGSETVGFAQAAALSATGDLAAAQTLAFSTAGSLSAKSAIQAAEPLAFSASATLVATGELAGAASLAFAAQAQPAVSGTASIAFSSAAALGARMPVSASEAVAFSTLGDLTARAALAASETVSFAPVAAITGRNAIAASETVAFSTAAALGARGDLSAFAEITVTATAGATLTGALAASETIAFEATASGAAIALADAAATIAFSEVAALAGTGALLGSEPLSVSASGTVLGAGVLAASASVAFAPAAQLRNAAAGQIDAAATLAFTGSATATASGALAASEAVTFSDAGALLGAGELSGAAAIAFSGTAAVQSDGSLAASEAMSVSATATAIGAGVLAASGTVEVTGAGDLAASGELAALESIALSGSATGIGAGALDGDAAVAFSASATLTNAAQGQIAGAATLAFGGVATAAGQGVLEASEAMAFTVDGLVTGAGALSGATSLAFGKTANLNGTGALAAQEAFAVITSGEAKATGALIGAKVIIFIDAASLTDGSAVFSPSRPPLPERPALPPRAALSARRIA